MSDTDQDEAKRRRRARFVEVLTSSARQPGERSRLGSRVAGATAVLALAAGATMGIGAWRGHQADQDAKELTAAQTKAADRLAHLPTGSVSPTAKKPTPKPSHSATPKAPVHTTHAPTPSPKRSEKATATPTPTIAVYPSTALLLNAATALCADIPYFGAGKVGGSVNTHKCDGTSNDNQIWNMRVQPVGKGPGGTDLVLFVNAKDDLCLDMPNRGPQPAGTTLNEANCDGTLADNQLWWLEPVGNSAVHIRSFISGNLCIRPGNVSPGGSDRRLMIATCGTNDESRWFLYPVSA
ncbi:RICIN domain-containing protein [Streptomyces sp. NPDC093221]|uniref:RICIN domain-containing protein n=1 Tax=Streptomyces sp. NPDC093221 TaxID=3366032 RepID=UPI00381A0628